jgi:hypothetical protein
VIDDSVDGLIQECAARNHGLDDLKVKKSGLALNPKPD